MRTGRCLKGVVKMRTFQLEAPEVRTRTEYVVTIRNGDYPLMYHAATITDAFQCLVTAEQNRNLRFSAGCLDTDKLMEVLVRLQEGSLTEFSSDDSYVVERVTTPVEEEGGNDG